MSVHAFRSLRLAVGFAVGGFSRKARQSAAESGEAERHEPVAGSFQMGSDQAAGSAGERLFCAHEGEVERAIAEACQRNHLDRRQMERFSTMARRVLHEEDCRLLRAIEGRSSLATYLSVVLQRLFFRSGAPGVTGGFMAEPGDRPASPAGE
jgi:hypothetical protein